MKNTVWKLRNGTPIPESSAAMISGGTAAYRVMTRTVRKLIRRSCALDDQKYCASAKKKTVKTPSMDIPKKAMQNITKATPEIICPATTDGLSTE